MEKIRVKKLHENAKVPTRAHEDDAGLDIYALKSVNIGPGERAAVGTGIALEIPFGYVGLIWDKSGLSFGKGLKTMGGVIDAGYRGEVKIALINLGTEKIVLNAGDKIAQLLTQKVELCAVEEVAELSDGIRGANGFGSTGK